MPNFDPIRTETGWRVELDALALEVDNPHGDAGVIRAVLTIWRNGVIHYRDRVNLTSAKTRARLIAKLADKNIVLDERVLVALDEVCRRPPPEAEVDPEDVDAQRRTAWFLCADLARDTRILDRVAAVVRQIGLVGEERAVKLLYLIVSSRLLDKPISVALKGPSSVGKSFLVEQVLTLFPPSAFHALSAMSERALAYDDEPVAHRMLVLYEAAGLQGDFASYLARSLLSEGRISYTTVEKTKDGLRPRHIEREGPTGLIVTTTALKLHPENETRLLSLAITDTPEQTAAVLKKLAEERSNTAALAPWHALQTWLETAEHRVVIPYAPVLAKMIPPIAVRLRRDFGAVLNLVRAHALRSSNLARGTPRDASSPRSKTTASSDSWCTTSSPTASRPPCRRRFARPSKP